MAGASPRAGGRRGVRGRAAFGCGASGGDGYLSPVSAPLGFLSAAVTRLPTLVGDAVFNVPAEFATLPPAAGTVAVLGAVAGVVFAVLLRAVWPRSAPSERDALRWLLPGAVVAMFAGLGGFPGAREIMVPNLGFAPALAVVLLHGFASGRGA
ncbi:MAG TPA: hypothetical protein VHV30_16200, partial [Polyangiaceae bacterium]|nr:hypothetical protein [Polyangiaceae bacterium]